jgi:hypothetical protein
MEKIKISNAGYFEAVSVTVRKSQITNNKFQINSKS